MIKPRLIDVNIDVDKNKLYCAYDYGMYKNDVTLLKILEPYTVKFDLEFNDSSVLSYCINAGNIEVLDYVLKNNILKEKGVRNIGLSYQKYLNLALLYSEEAPKNGVGE